MLRYVQQRCFLSLSMQNETHLSRRTALSVSGRHLTHGQHHLKIQVEAQVTCTPALVVVRAHDNGLMADTQWRFSIHNQRWPRSPSEFAWTVTHSTSLDDGSRTTMQYCTSLIHKGEVPKPTIPGPPSKERIGGILYGDSSVT